MPFPILLTLLLSVVPALSTPLVTERTEGTCNRDNVLRALIDKRYIDEAIPFCSKYIKVPASTVTATTSCQTVTITAIVDPLPVTTTITPTVTVTATTPGSTVYSTYVPPYYKEKRDEPVPAFVSQYPASRISSACSCLTITPSTTTVPCPIKTVATTIKPPAPTITITASPPATTTTTVAGPATTLPALCNPSLFLDYRSGVDREGFGGLVQTSDATKQACCVACFRAGNCTAFQFRPDNPPETRCEYYTRRSPTDPSNRKDICPLGVTIGSELQSPVGSGTGTIFLNYGPCLDRSPLSG
ncbi:hypothetical protein EPUS_07395 [Endocarpon pusillum Z07020]|uniref:Apple domain-containing protein n=1 Tax=Endocarpon pusillum (strain Z07020 / HMAS-L-300199) TaxID=1263415 RepID=U1HZ77_ENDPU|nr:uncharacterized protein EPUS_07395 [Endocarpon pusillum Z07020]ERF76195.1 hypothetical protein EPUS_07395 [Endocarpon pusillum Z07020]